MRRAEKQSIAVNGQLTPTIEVTTGQVLEVTSQQDSRLSSSTRTLPALSLKLAL